MRCDVMDEWKEGTRQGGEVVDRKRIISNGEWLTCGQAGAPSDQPN